MGKLAWVASLSILAVGWTAESPSGRVEVGGDGATSAAGTVGGHVAVSTVPQRPPASLSPYARRRSSPPQEPGVPGGEEDAIVYLEPLSGGVVAPPGEPASITQRDRTILPHVAVVRVGQTVEFPNEDDVFHNLFSLSPGNRFSLGRYAPGVTERNVFESQGVVRLFCDIHAEMAGVILVVDTPHVARVRRGGEYRLDRVPAGRYRAIAWHPTAGADTALVEVGTGDALDLDFELSGSR